MKTTKELLAELNLLRVTNGKPAIKAWKESRAKLEAAITKALGNSANVATAEHSTDTKPAPARQTSAKGGSAKKGDDNALSVYCAKHDINPKVARAKLRRAGLSAPYTHDQVIKHLSGK